MYLSEEKRVEIRKCIVNSKVSSDLNSIEDKIATIKGFQGTEKSSKVSQILFDARDGKEVFTPFQVELDLINITYNFDFDKQYYFEFKYSLIEEMA